MYNQQIYNQQQGQRHHLERKEMSGRDEYLSQDFVRVENRGNPYGAMGGRTDVHLQQQRPVYGLDERFQFNNHYAEMYHQRTPSLLSVDDQQSTNSKTMKSNKSQKNKNVREAPQKTKSYRNPVKYFREDIINEEVIDEIKAINSDMKYLEKDLTYVFPGFKLATPFFLMKNPPTHHLESTTVRKQTAQRSISREDPVREVRVESKDKVKEIRPHPDIPNKKKVNKYVQNYMDKYEPELKEGERANLGKVKGYQGEMKEANLKTKQPDASLLYHNKHNPADNMRHKVQKPNLEHQPDLQSTRHDPSSAFNLPTNTENIQFESTMNHAHNQSNVSSTSSKSKRRENFENFKRNYFGMQDNDTPKQNNIRKQEGEDGMDRFTRTSKEGRTNFQHNNAFNIQFK